MMTDLKQLVDETLEDLCKRYPRNDHQALMRASFEIFASRLLWKEFNECKRRERERQKWRIMQFRWFT